MSTHTLRSLTLILPLLSLLIAMSIVLHQYKRHYDLTRELYRTEQRYFRLARQLPQVPEATARRFRGDYEHTH